MKRTTAALYSLRWCAGFAALALSLAVASCGNKNLSKEQALSQIDTVLTQYPYEVEIMSNHKYYTEDDFASMMIDNIHRLADSGYLRYSAQTSGQGYDAGMSFDLTMSEKIKPFILSRTDYPPLVSYKLTAGNPVAEITAINEPAADASGNVVCNVLFHQAMGLNGFGRVIGYTEEKYKNYVRKPDKIARFVKTQDGWRLDHIDGMNRR